jgi:hypothetical protein
VFETPGGKFVVTPGGKFVVTPGGRFVDEPGTAFVLKLPGAPGPITGGGAAFRLVQAAYISATALIATIAKVLIR